MNVKDTVNNLNEEMSTTEGLKKFCGGFIKRNKRSISNIPGFETLSPEGVKYQLKETIKKYNSIVETYNALKSKMLGGRVLDAEVSSAKNKLKSMDKDLTKLESKIADYTRKSSKRASRKETETMKEDVFSLERKIKNRWSK